MLRYSELCDLQEWSDRIAYLSLLGIVGEETFGSARWANQAFYRSKEWRDAKRHAIIRDNGCDLGVPGYEIFGRMIVHHIEPITQDDIVLHSPKLLDLDNLITVTIDTHNLIHYGTGELIRVEPNVRTPNDTCPWKEA